MFSYKRVIPYAVLLLSVVLGLLMVTGIGSASLLFAQGEGIDEQPTAPIDQGLQDSPDLPPMIESAPYPFPYVYTDRTANPTPNQPLDGPTINVWYGNPQQFGAPGNPQEWVNILGNVTGPKPITSLTYSLNGGPVRPLTIGPDRFRLQLPGDFNIELPYTQLNNGANQVTITASDGTDMTVESVTVNYDAGNTWPLPYQTDWETTSDLTDAVQVVDGLWRIESGRLRTQVVGYDRLVAVGDMSWTDYEITVPITVRGLSREGLSDQGQNAGIGFILRWRGHTELADEQPRRDWKRLGALGWFRWRADGTSGVEMRGNGGVWLKGNPNKQIQVGVPYVFKMSVQSAASGPSYYRFKIWPAGENEPAAWDVQGFGATGEPTSGSALIVAHQLDASIGDITVRPLTAINPTITTSTDGNGSIIVSPNQPSYTYAQRVSVRAVPKVGYRLASWGGDLSGSDSPKSFNITKDMTISATFVEASPPTLDVTSNGNGTVKVEPDKEEYQFGESVKLTPIPAPGYLFAGWSGDLDGGNNPAVIVMDDDKVIQASFAPANAQSPKSDDFNSCALNQSVWTFVNPLGDAELELNGTQAIINIPAGTAHDIWRDGNKAPRLMQPTANQDFEMSAKFQSPVQRRVQMQGLLVEQDANNFLRFELYSDGSKTLAFAAKFVNGTPTPVITGTVTPQGNDSYLRVTRAADLWGFSYSFDGQNWVAAGSFEHPLNVTKSGVYGGNDDLGGPAPAYEAVIDYFFNTAAPIAPEDGKTNTVQVTVTGNGTVNLNPNKPTYACGEVVTLTAVPDSGWKFKAWGGALSGSETTKTLTVTGRHTVTALFELAEAKVFLPMVRRP